MKYVDEFRNRDTARALSADITRLAAELAAAGKERVVIMEVCGSHTMAIAKYGIKGVLPGNVLLRSGPGCPVCVTNPGFIDAAIKLAGQGAIVATFGDMLKVPGSSATLSDCRSRGGRIEVCYSPLGALDIARNNKDSQVVFLAVGFETTVAPFAGLVDIAVKEGIKNLSLLTAFKLIPPALRALLADKDAEIDAFLCPAHVSAIIGAEAYNEFAVNLGTPCVIAGFEPLDILYGVKGALDQFVSGKIRVDNQYNRVVKQKGNPRALSVMDKYFKAADADWRGIGVLPESGLELRREYAGYDACNAFGITIEPGLCRPGCMCGDVLKGIKEPEQCGLFGVGCTPDDPAGPCMVSSEGVCAAHYKYRMI